MSNNTIYVKIDGIFCDHCRNTIVDGLGKLKGIEKVTVKGDIAHIEFKDKVNRKEIINTVNKLGYSTKQDYISDNKWKFRKTELIQYGIILLTLLFLIFISYKILGYNIFNMIPTIDSSITYGMLVITGLFTSIHCISMCGAINLVAVYQQSTGKNRVLNPILYNTGRLISYTLIGGIVGALGSILSISAQVSGIIILIAAILMLLMALKMMGVINISSIGCFNKSNIQSKNSFIIGILNGFMPCGPLQAMQLYALSTGSAWLGAISMFLFGLGTVPLMLSIGLIISILNGKGRFWITKVSSILILVLSIIMINRALIAFGIDITRVGETNTVGTSIVNVEDNKGNQSEQGETSTGDKASSNSGTEDIQSLYPGYSIAEIDESGEFQTVETTLDYSDYGDIVVYAGIPVKFTIKADRNYITGCNYQVEIPSFGIKHELSEGDNLIEFTPTETGDYEMVCWMYMIINNIKVIDYPS